MDAQRRLYRLKPEPLQELDAWLAPFRRFWSAHVDALERHLDRMDPASTPTEKKDKEKKMTDREQYTPGPASGAEVRKDGDKWTLVLVRELRHPPDKVWQALTDPAQLREWAPFDADGSLGTVGPREAHHGGRARAARHRNHGDASRRASAARVHWGGNDMRWELEAVGSGTRLTLWHSIDRRYIAMGAAGWHICFDVLDRLLGGTPIGRIVGADAMKFEGWQRLTRRVREAVRRRRCPLDIETRRADE